MTGARAREFFETGRYLDRNPIIPIRARHVASLLFDLHDGSVLDLGCGDGSLSRPLADNRVTLVDLSAAMLDRARQNVPRARCVQADVLEWEPDGLYDAVLAVGLLAHVDSPQLLLQKVAAALRPGGRCILQVTDGASPLGWLLTRYGRIRRREGYRLNELTRRQLTERAAAFGLTPVAARRYGLLLPGTGWLPYRWQVWIEDRFASGLLSRVTAEVLVMFRKETP